MSVVVAKFMIVLLQNLWVFLLEDYECFVATFVIFFAKMWNCVTDYMSIAKEELCRKLYVYLKTRIVSPTIHLLQKKNCVANYTYVAKEEFCHELYVCRIRRIVVALWILVADDSWLTINSR